MQTANILEKMRETAPLVHCMTNFVAMNTAANAVLAVGASPAMVMAEEEAGDFARIAGALTINIGTLDKISTPAMIKAARAAHEAATPWVLDPVAVFLSDFRRDTVAALLEAKPDVIRGNASEILALNGQTGSGKGADSGDSVEAAREAAMDLAKSTGAVVAVTGDVDFVTDGVKNVRIHGGHEVMPRITTMGCALTAVIGAFIAVHDDMFEATVAALAAFGVAGRAASDISTHPGSFWPVFLDALYSLHPETLDNQDVIETL